MFNVVEKNQKLVKGIMITVAATFVLWGIGGYLGNSGDDGYVAKVGNAKIYTRDIDQAIQQNPQNPDKMQAMFGLINRQLLLNNIDAYHLTATKNQLQQQIAAIPAFQNAKGEFSLSKYQEFLNERFMSAEQFQVNVGQQILLNEYLDLFKNSYFSSSLFDKSFAKLLSRERSVSSYTVNTEQFYGKINPTDKEVSDFYAQNVAKFTKPERAKVQYLVLDTATVAQNIQISDADLNKYIQTHAAASGEQIDASHILLTVPADANAQTKADIKAKAENILAMAKKNPGQFAALAKQYSQDPGSADRGGDLGYFAKGVMAKPFEDAAFNLKPGQISAVVETQYGYHIIKLNSIKANDQQEVRKMALAQLQKQQAVTALQKSLDKLNDLTYNQPTSLDPAAKQLGLTVQTSPNWIEKGSLTGSFANPKAQAAIFNQDVIKRHNNSEVVDLGDGSYAVYHVTEYSPAKVLTLDEVKPQIVQQLKTQAATNMAVTEGQKQIAALQKGSANLSFSKAENISLIGQSADINSNSVKQIFGTNIAKLPAYTGGMDAKGNFVIYKINDEHINPKLEAQNEKITTQIASSDSMLVLGAYMNSLRSIYKVSYKIDRLNLQSK